MAARKKPIDLIPREGFEFTTAGKILSWALTAGRVIVIVTELVVILAFLSRFWLDRELTDLNDEIESQVAIISASKEFEDDFRGIQGALASFSQITQREPDLQGILDRTVASLPAEVSLQTINWSPDGLAIKGVSLSEVGIAGLIKNLQDSGFEDVQLTSISFGGFQTGEIGITFGLSAKPPK